MATPGQFISMTVQVLSWVRALRQADVKRKSELKSALKMLQAAVLKTKIYVAELERGAPVDRRRESELAFLWAETSNAFYGLDSRLAERLQLKGEYWTQPELWTPEQITGAGISLQHVAEQTRQLLHES